VQVCLGASEELPGTRLHAKARLVRATGRRGGCPLVELKGHELGARRHAEFVEHVAQVKVDSDIAGGAQLVGTGTAAPAVFG
jgi:hypothetical protein